MSEQRAKPIEFYDRVLSGTTQPVPTKAMPQQTARETPISAIMCRLLAILHLLGSAAIAAVSVEKLGPFFACAWVASGLLGFALLWSVSDAVAYLRHIRDGLAR